uniref:genetic suppressor element 1 n=1 Tax=Lonchura striata TaxID=40157 RepID=UPI000B4D3248
MEERSPRWTARPAGMSHEPKSPSLGMLSTATRTTATVSPLTPSPLNGSIVPNGSPAASSTLSVQAAPSSSFAAALRKLAKQAEEPRGSSLSSESSPVSSPATNHSSPASTPKRGPMGPILVPPGGHSVPSTPPVVTIAPTKTVNGVWRSEGRQQEAGSRGSSSSAGRERLISEPPLAQEKAGGPTVPSHLLGTPYSFGLPPSSVVQDSRFPPLNLQRPVHHVVPPSAVTEDYLRSFRPYHTAEDLRMSSLPPLGLDPATAAAYYHPSYLTHHPFPHPAFRMDESYCLSALRSPFYPLPAPGSLPPLHPSAMHLHLSGVRYPPELSHSSLSALQSERISSLAAERLQMDEELRQREREREKEREREADREREKEREREREREKELEREREKERERELERQRERAREKELSMVKAMEGPFLPVAELHGLRGHPAEERGKPVEPLAPSRADKLKDSVLPTPKPIQHPLHPPPGSHHPVPSLIPNHSVFPLAGSSAATALLIHRTNEEEKWLARQRRLRQEKEDRQSQVSEFRQQVLEQHLDIGRAPSQAEPEHRPEHPRLGSSRHEPSSREPGQHFGGPPPLISPKPQHHPVTTSLWNPVSLMESPPDPPRRLPEPHALHSHPAPFEPGRQSFPVVKVERVFCPEKLEEGPRKRDALEKYPPGREPGAPEHGAFTHTPFLAELEKSTQSILSQQRAPAAAFPESSKPSSPYRPPQPRAQDPMYIYDEFVQQHRRLVSKLDLEERRRREAREKGYYYDLDDSCDDSDEEEVRAHLRCVAEQPPLKLDTSSEKLEFLQLFGLTTQQQKEELLSQKRRKRRRMLRERSPSPPTVQNKRRTPSPRPPLSTRYSPDEMNNSPNFEEKKRFLTIFNLTHISAEKRKDKEKLVEMLQAMKQKTTPAAVVVKSSPRDSPGAPSTEPPVPPLLLELDKPVGIAVSVPEVPKVAEASRLDQLRPQEPPRPKESGTAPEKPRLSDGHPGKKALSILSYVRGPLPKDIPVPLSHSMNGKSKPWEPFIAEEFAHQFHESVLQSTQKALQKHKGGTAEQNHKLDTSIHYNIPELQASAHPPAPPHNGTAEGPLRPLPPLPRDSASEDEDEEEEEEEEEEDYPRPKWQGIEAIFEAYQEHIEEQNLERQVLQTQCRRLEAQHYTLSLTAEQLSHSMAVSGDSTILRAPSPWAHHALGTHLLGTPCLGHPAPGHTMPWAPISWAHHALGTQPLGTPCLGHSSPGHTMPWAPISWAHHAAIPWALIPWTPLPTGHTMTRALHPLDTPFSRLPIPWTLMPWALSPKRSSPEHSSPECPSPGHSIPWAHHTWIPHSLGTPHLDTPFPGHTMPWTSPPLDTPFPRHPIPWTPMPWAYPAVGSRLCGHPALLGTQPSCDLTSGHPILPQHIPCTAHSLQCQFPGVPHSLQFSIPCCIPNLAEPIPCTAHSLYFPFPAVPIPCCILNQAVPIPCCI